MAEKELDELYDLIGDIEVAMLTTRREDGRLVSRPMATQDRSRQADLWFVTNIETDKLEEIESDPNVNVAYYDDSTREWVSVSGTARISTDREQIHELYSVSWKPWFPDEGGEKGDAPPEHPHSKLEHKLQQEGLSHDMIKKIIAHVKETTGEGEEEEGTGEEGDPKKKDKPKRRTRAKRRTDAERGPGTQDGRVKTSEETQQRGRERELTADSAEAQHAEKRKAPVHERLDELREKQKDKPKPKRKPQAVVDVRQAIADLHKLEKQLDVIRISDSPFMDLAEYVDLIKQEKGLSEAEVQRKLGVAKNAIMGGRDVEHALLYAFEDTLKDRMDRRFSKEAVEYRHKKQWEAYAKTPEARATAAAFGAAQLASDLAAMGWLQRKMSGTKVKPSDVPDPAEFHAAAEAGDIKKLNSLIKQLDSLYARANAGQPRMEDGSGPIRPPGARPTSGIVQRITAGANKLADAVDPGFLARKVRDAFDVSPQARYVPKKKKGMSIEDAKAWKRSFKKKKEGGT